jgi:hypothetical protein
MAPLNTGMNEREIAMENKIKQYAWVQGWWPQRDDGIDPPVPIIAKEGTRIL